MKRTAFGFRDTRSGRRAPEVFDDTTITASTRTLARPEVVLEHGFAHRFEPDGIAVEGDFVAISLDSAPLEMEVKIGSRFEHRAMPPRSFFVQPAGIPMTQRNFGGVEFCAVELPTAWSTAVLGRRLELTPARGLVDEQLALLMSALRDELASGCTAGPMYLETLVTAFAMRLARIHDAPDEPEREGTLDPRTLQRIIDHIDASLADRFTVLDLAQIAGLSVAHFAREFKRATGMPPYAFVLQRRIALARQLLAAGATIATAATRAGFADQSHLTRAFRRELGVTPGAFRRGRSS